MAQEKHLGWTSYDSKSSFKDLVVPVSNSASAYLGEWNLSVDAFLKAVVTLRCKGYGVNILSPLLTINISTLKVIRLAWYILPLFHKALVQKGNERELTTLVVLANTFNGTQWKCPNESFYWIIIVNIKTG